MENWMKYMIRNVNRAHSPKMFVDAYNKCAEIDESCSRILYEKDFCEALGRMCVEDIKDVLEGIEYSQLYTSSPKLFKYNAKQDKWSCADITDCDFDEFSLSTVETVFDETFRDWR